MDRKDFKADIGDKVELYVDEPRSLFKESRLTKYSGYVISKDGLDITLSLEDPNTSLRNGIDKIVKYERVKDYYFLIPSKDKKE